MCKNIIVLGASGHGKVISEIIKLNGDNFLGFLDDDLSKGSVMGDIASCVDYKDCHFIIGIGDNESRKKISFNFPDLKYCNAIHPNAVIAKSAKIGLGTVIMANAIVNSNATIGQHCIINTASIIEHDDIIEDYVHISPNATLCGNVFVGECSHIGASSTIRNNIKIHNNIIIGCGGVVVSDIVEKGIYVGVPVKKYR